MRKEVARGVVVGVEVQRRREEEKGRGLEWAWRRRWERGEGQRRDVTVG